VSSAAACEDLERVDGEKLRQMATKGGERRVWKVRGTSQYACIPPFVEMPLCQPIVFVSPRFVFTLGTVALVLRIRSQSR